MENMEKTKSVLKSSTRIIIIGVIVVVLIFLSFLMVSIVPKILSSMANSTVSLTSSFFPSGNSGSSTNGTSSGITLDGTTATNNGTASSTPSKNESFLTSFFGPRKTNNNNTSNNTNSQVNFSVATSTRQNYNNNNNQQVAYNNNSNNNSNNNYQRPAGIPDLAVQITSIGIINANGAFVPTNNVTVSDTVVVKFKIENQGSGASGAWSMRVNMPSSNVNDQVKTITANSLPAGRAITGQAVFNTPSLGTNQQVTIYVDPNGSISESNENNNQASIRLNVTQPYNYNYNNNNYYNNNCVNGYVNGVYNYNCNNYNNNYNNYNNQPNLTVSLVSLEKIDIYNQFTQTTYLRTTDKVAVKFNVTNNSSVYTSSWSWKAQLFTPSPYYNVYNNYNNNYNTNGYTYNSDGSRTYNSIIVESGLAPGETRSYTTTFDNLNYGSNNLTITIDSGNNISESNEGDNTINQSFFVNY